MSNYKSRPLQLSDVDSEIVNHLSTILKQFKKDNTNYEPLHSFLSRRSDQVIQVWSKLREVGAYEKLPYIMHHLTFF